MLRRLWEAIWRFFLDLTDPDRDVRAGVRALVKFIFLEIRI